MNRALHRVKREVWAKDPKMNNVMVDLETLGTVANSVIMSIGAVRFDLETDKIDDAAFYASISIDSNIRAGRQISEATLLWWLGQPTGAQMVFHEQKESLEGALESFTEWFGAGAAGAGKTNIWSNGADFDLPMLAHAYDTLGWETPWVFYNSRCVRTYKNLPAAKNVPKQEFGVKHNALHDAINQVKHVQAIHKVMTARLLPGKAVA
jgi:hypothetical protein